MKKLSLILITVLIAFGSFAQRGALKTLPVDTIKGAETIYWTPIELNSTWNSLSISVLCSQLGGTSDGTVSVLASNDGTNYFTFNNVSGSQILISPYARVNDSIIGKLNVYNAATLNFVIPNPPHRYYKLTSTGTASDTTKLSVTYVYK